MKKNKRLRLLFHLFLTTILCLLCTSWGFFGHRHINELAVYCLPSPMIGFYKANLEYIRDASVNPDKRRRAVVDEASRHFIDLDHYGDSAIHILPKFWNQAKEKFPEDTLKEHGVAPWHINTMYYRLKEAFIIGDPQTILRLSAEMGHYVADIHVPLHTTQNYNGQLTGQHGIHGFWEARVPELFYQDYDFFVGKATYIKVPQLEIWKVVANTHLKVDSVLQFEKQLTLKFGERKYAFEQKGKQLLKVYSKEFTKAYHDALHGMIERQMRASVKMIADLWYTAWVDAGQPDIKRFISVRPSEQELAKRKEEVETWKNQTINVRTQIDVD